MRKLVFVLGLGLALSGCARKENALEIPAGSDVTVQKKDGVNVAGKLVETRAQEVVLESRDGVKRIVPRSEIESIKATPVDDAKKEPAPAAPAAPAPPAAPKPDDKADNDKTAARSVPEYREVTIPAGTTLSLELKTAVASDTSKVEDQVRAALRSPVTVNGVRALPEGTAVLGHVTSAERSGKVKGRASIAFRFNTIDLPDGGHESISTATVSRVAAPTKKKDATKIGIGAGAGAAIGAIVGGGGGAAKGAAIGGAAGTGAVLATRGEEVRLGPGAAVTTRLTAPLTVRVPMK